MVPQLRRKALTLISASCQEHTLTRNHIKTVTVSIAASLAVVVGVGALYFMVKDREQSQRMAEARARIEESNRRLTQQEQQWALEKQRQQRESQKAQGRIAKLDPMPSISSPSPGANPLGRQVGSIQQKPKANSGSETAVASQKEWSRLGEMCIAATARGLKDPESIRALQIKGRVATGAANNGKIYDREILLNYTATNSYGGRIANTAICSFYDGVLVDEYQTNL